jgi:hypothetical protein
MALLLGGFLLLRPKRSGPTQEVLQADAPQLETEEFY